MKSPLDAVTVAAPPRVGPMRAPPAQPQPLPRGPLAPPGTRNAPEASHSAPAAAPDGGAATISTSGAASPQNGAETPPVTEDLRSVTGRDGSMGDAAYPAAARQPTPQRLHEPPPIVEGVPCGRQLRVRADKKVYIGGCTTLLTAGSVLDEWGHGADAIERLRAQGVEFDVVHEKRPAARRA